MRRAALALAALLALTSCAMAAGEEKRPHPRTLDPAAVRAHFAAAGLGARVRAEASQPLPSLPEGTKAETKRQIQSIAFGAEDRILRLALHGAVMRDEETIAAAKEAALRLATWPPRGASGFFQHDQAARAVAWTLALTLDWLYDRFTPSERAALLDAIRPRVEDMLASPREGLPTGWAGLDWGRKLDRWPYDPHGAVTLARLAVICTALAGEDALFDRCAEAVVPRYLARPIPWGDQGGYANGTNYAQWDVLFTHFVVWHLLKNALGRDLWQSDWAKGYLNFMAYFLPPGAPTGLFGDGAEQRHAWVWAAQAKAYAAALPSPLADWYARNQFGENPLHLALLLAPARDWSTVPGALPPGTPHSVHLADIGWVALHSDLGDRARTSVYFKSSPYGSYNHSHADQNSFVIHARGRVLAADSGYYDDYGSPHWKDWYKQTRAHNAITFDGGQGQMHDTMKARGGITHFEHHAEYDIATGDATEAYGGALSKAIRTLVYLRPNTVLVYDTLESATPRTWEWNLHALSPMKARGARELEIEQDGVRLCVNLLSAPPGAIGQTEQFTTPPPGSYPRQWHARFATGAKARRGVFLALLDVDCGQPDFLHSQSGERRIVDIGGMQFTFSPEGDVKRVK